MASEARGTFEVTLSPQLPAPGTGDPTISRLTLDKRFVGDLVGSSRGEMLTGTTARAGSAGYVAIERFVGTLGGQRGSFLLQHSGTLDRGQPTLSVGVIADSGTDELIGLTGTMTLERVDGTHHYRFDYSLPTT